MPTPFSIPRPNSAVLMRQLDFEPDPWQLDVLDGRHKRLLLNCCRQSGKSTVVALLALLEAMFEPFAKVLLLSRSLRQSSELFRLLNFFHRRFKHRLKEKLKATELTFTHMSRVLCLPCREDTIRGFSGVNLIVIDEAARVPDDLYRAVRPMLAVSEGRIICLSTPYGKRGFFWREWAHGGDDWHRIEVPATNCPRISPTFLEAERRSLGDSWFRQEYLCSFESQEGLVFPDMHRCVVDKLPDGYPTEVPKFLHQGYWNRGHWRDVPIYQDHTPWGQWVGGLDFGFRNPTAAVWGLLDREDVLWLCGEHYAAQKPLAYHAERLPKPVIWYADPSGASDISGLKRASFIIKQGANAIREGISAVTQRINTGRLKILKGRCPNLLREADLYRYPSASEGLDPTVDSPDSPASEKPIDANNHALAALRYLIARIDQHKQTEVPLITPPPPREEQERDPNDERYWQPLW